MVTKSREQFYTLRAKLINQGLQFSLVDILELPYDEMILCAMGNAGAARAPLSLVLEAMRMARPTKRESSPRVVGNNVAIFLEDSTDINIEGCIDYETLSDKLKCCTILLCLSNHCDCPETRIAEIRRLLDRMDKTHGVSNRAVTDWVRLQLAGIKLDNIHSTHQVFLATAAEVLLKFLTTEEEDILKRFIHNGKVRNYKCTYGCFPVATN